MAALKFTSQGLSILSAGGQVKHALSHSRIFFLTFYLFVCLGRGREGECVCVFMLQHTVEVRKQLADISFLPSTIQDPGIKFRPSGKETNASFL